MLLLGLIVSSTFLYVYKKKQAAIILYYNENESLNPPKEDQTTGPIGIIGIQAWKSLGNQYTNDHHI